MTPTGSAANGEAMARWQSSAAYKEMMAALEAEGWPDYETANAEKWANVARYKRMELEWERRMQARGGIDPLVPAKGAAGLRAGATTRHSSRGFVGSSGRRGGAE